MLLRWVIESLDERIQWCCYWSNGMRQWNGMGDANMSFTLVRASLGRIALMPLYLSWWSHDSRSLASSLRSSRKCTQLRTNVPIKASRPRDLESKFCSWYTAYRYYDTTQKNFEFVHAFSLLSFIDYWILIHFSSLWFLAKIASRWIGDCPTNDRHGKYSRPCPIHWRYFLIFQLQQQVQQLQQQQQPQQPPPGLARTGGGGLPPVLENFWFFTAELKKNSVFYDFPATFDQISMVSPPILKIERLPLKNWRFGPALLFRHVFYQFDVDLWIHDIKNRYILTAYGTLHQLDFFFLLRSKI